MWWTIGIILLILWLLGVLAFHVGGLIHVLLVVALIIILWRVVAGRKAI